MGKKSSNQELSHTGSQVSESVRRSEASGTSEEALERVTKQVAKGGGIALFGRIGGRGILFLFQILLTRVLGAQMYGLYALGQSVMRITQQISMLGLQNGIVRFGAMYRGEGDKRRLKGTILFALVISTATSFAAGLLLFFLANWIAVHVFDEPGLAAVLRGFALSLPFYTILTVSAFSARAFRRMEYDVGIYEVFHPTVTLIIVGISFLLGFRLMGVVYGFLISSVLSSALSLFLIYRMFPDLLSNLRPVYELQKFLPYSLTVFLVGFSYLFLSQTDRVMLGYFGAAQDVGVYKAAAVTAYQLTVILGAFNAILSPIIADLHNQHQMGELEALFKTVGRWTLTLTLPAFLVIVLFGEKIMGIFGPGFVGGLAPLVVLGAAQAVSATAGSAVVLLTMAGYQKVALANGVALGLLNILLNVWLIPRYGILGAATATGISIVLINAVRLVEVYFLLRMHPYKLAYWKAMVAGGVLVVSWWILERFFSFFFDGRMWIGKMLACGIVYGATLILLGFEPEDRMILRAVRTRFLRH